MINLNHLNHKLKVIKVYDVGYYRDFICEKCNISGYHYQNNHDDLGAYIIRGDIIFNTLTCEEIIIKRLLE